MIILIMKNLLFLLFLISPFSVSFAQDQTINGSLKLNGNIILQGDQNPSTFGEYGRKLYFGYPYENTDDMWLSRLNVSADVSELRLNIGDYIGDRFLVGSHNPASTFSPIFTVHTSGYITVGSITNPNVIIYTNGTIKGKKLDIIEKIRAAEVEISKVSSWSDFVFNKDYKLPSLSEVENHIKEKGTLPDIPSEKEVMQSGINLGEMQAKLLQKIEELTLYVIELKKENEAQNILIKQLQNVNHK